MGMSGEQVPEHTPSARAEAAVSFRLGSWRGFVEAAHARPLGIILDSAFPSSPAALINIPVLTPPPKCPSTLCSPSLLSLPWSTLRDLSPGWWGMRQGQVPCLFLLYSARQGKIAQK